MQVVKKGTQSNLLVYYMFHEVDEGLEEIEAGRLDAAEGGSPWSCWQLRCHCSSRQPPMLLCTATGEARKT